VRTRYVVVRKSSFRFFYNIFSNFQGYGETCKFFCRSGFKPSGVVICGANGAWSNDQSCEGKSY